MAVEKNTYVHKRNNLKGRSFKQRFMLFLFMNVSIVCFTENSIVAQDRFEIGAFGGMSYYIGDLNPSARIVDAQPALGGLLRYVFNDRLAIKGSLMYAGLKGSYDTTFVGVLPRYDRVNGTPGNFKRNTLSVMLTGEVNFFSYDHKYISSSVFTPYIALGIGGLGYNRLGGTPDTTFSKPHLSVILPLGLGVKYKFSDWVRVGAEWSFVKTFVDDVDNYKGLGEALHNNDWFSVFKIYITFGFFRRKSECYGM